MQTKKYSQEETVLKHIVKYGSLSGKSAYGLYDILRLAAIIHKLTQLGFVFKTKRIHEGIEGKRGRKPVEYMLDTTQREHAADLFEYNRLYAKFASDAK